MPELSLLLVLLLSPALAAGQPRRRWADFEGRAFAFWDVPLGWDSAAVVCERTGMTLSAPADEDVLRWAADHAGGAWATWLGGRRGDPATPDPENHPWLWDSVGEPVETSPDAWVDAAPKEHCLALATTPPHLAALADLPCATPLPFVCERADRSQDNYVESVQLMDRTLTFVESLSTYEAAVAACESFNGELVTANTAEIQKALLPLAKKMRSLWVGAKTDGAGVARWRATDQEVPLLGARSLLLFEEDSELVVTHDEVTLKKTKRAVAAPRCVHFTRKGQFKDADCETRRSYVCETRTKSYFPVTTEKAVGGARLRASTHPYPWASAARSCSAAKAAIGNLRQMDVINAVARLPQEFQDLWIDGQQGADGVWRDSEGREIPVKSDAAGYPPWASAPGRAAPGAPRCLTVYRQSLTEVLFVPRPCSEKHGFLCLKDH